MSDPTPDPLDRVTSGVFQVTSGAERRALDLKAGVENAVEEVAVGAAEEAVLARGAGHEVAAATGGDAIDDLSAEDGVARDPEPGLPPQSVYEYTGTGKERLSRGPVAESRDLPDRALMIVRHADIGYETEVRCSGDHVESVRYRLAGPGDSTIEADPTLTPLEPLL